MMNKRVDQSATTGLPANLSLRQTIEGMPLVFNPGAANGLAATIQFDIFGKEPGVYHLEIADSECRFFTGTAENPSLTITAPSDVWLKVSKGTLSGQDALMQGLYQANGDLRLLLKMDSLFGSLAEAGFEAPQQRPAGPIPLSGMAWMAVAFFPWMIFWITFDIPGVSHWINVGIPLFLAAFVVGYRLWVSRTTSSSTTELAQLPTLLDWSSLAFFAIAALLVWVENSWFLAWGSIIGTLFIGATWLVSLVHSQKPLSVDYAKWKFVKPLWHNSMFIYPNAVISLIWGWQFILSALCGIAALLWPEFHAPFTVVRYLLLVPAFVFTSVYEKRATQLRIDDYEGNMKRLRLWAGAGMACIAVLLIALVI